MRLCIHRPLSHRIVSTGHVRWKDQRFRFEKVLKSSLMPGLKKECSLSSFGRGATLCSLNSNSDAKLKYSGREITSVSGNGFDGVEPFRGKSGSVSFHGLTHQRVEESKLASSPFKEGTGSFLWVLAPVALISSLVLPQFFLDSAIEAILKDEVLAGTY